MRLTKCTLRSVAVRLPDEVKAPQDAANFWHLATINPDGSPHSTVMWMHCRGDRVRFNTALERVKSHKVFYRPPATR
jgi:hypothetical protein